jgi:hypothetical protein
VESGRSRPRCGGFFQGDQFGLFSGQQLVQHLLPDEVVFCEQHRFESGDIRPRDEYFHWRLLARKGAPLLIWQVLGGYAATGPTEKAKSARRLVFGLPVKRR